MSADLREFVIKTLADMNYDVSDIDDETKMGPEGLDLESLAVAELAVKVEENYGVRFGDEEMEQLASMTIGEFAVEVDKRVAAAETV